MTIGAKFFVPVEVAGPTGAVAATRYAGGTASGAPASGSFLKGDFVIDQTGKVWVCTVAGSPGTWVDVGGGGGGAVSSVFTRTGAVVAEDGDYYGAMAAALAGSTAASRYVGATTSGAPASGAHSVGDWVIAQNGHVFICTAAGTPGTWVDAGSSTGITFAATNIGAYLDVETTSTDGSGYGYHLKDSGGGGLLLEETTGNAFVYVASGSVSAGLGTGSSFVVQGHLGAELLGINEDGSDSAFILGTAGFFHVYNHSSAVIFGVPEATGGIQTVPPASSAPTLALGAAYQNTLGYDILLVVNVNITVNAAGSVLLGVGPTNTPTQQTIESGITALGPLIVPIYLPNNYYALLSAAGLTASIVGQIAMPV
jgi:hypothetical protein